MLISISKKLKIIISFDFKKQNKTNLSNPLAHSLQTQSSAHCRTV